MVTVLAMLFLVVGSVLLGCEADFLPLRHSRSTGCGENPLLKMLKVGMAEGHLSEVFRALDENSDLRSYVIASIRDYEDCVKAADGIKFKRSDYL